MSEIFSKILKDKNGKVLNVGSKYTQPEWGAEAAIVDILPETTFEVLKEPNGMAPIMNPLPYDLVGGNTYEVTYNGTNYSCVCYDYDDGTGGSGQLYLGNAAAAGIEDAPVTDEPFVVAFFYGQSLEQSGFPGAVLALDGSTTVTLSIKGAREKFYPIPNKYLDANMKPLFIKEDEDGGTWSGDYSELFAAAQAGRTVYFISNDNIRFFLVDIGNDEAHFARLTFVTTREAGVDHSDCYIRMRKVRADNTTSTAAWHLDRNFEM